jgi:hypothetical protein
MKFLKLSLACLLLTGILAGCATSEQSATENRKVSTTPWNKPQSWEGQGQLGGLMNH